MTAKNEERNDLKWTQAELSKATPQPKDPYRVGMPTMAGVSVGVVSTLVTATDLLVRQMGH